MKKMLTAIGISAVAFGAAACSDSSPTAPSATAPAATMADGSAAAPAIGAAAQAKPGHSDAAKPGDQTIVDIVLLPDGEFDVLQAAVVRAGVVDALNGPRQLTVFAPTDAAFVATLGVANEAAAIGAVNGLPVDTLTNILLNHVTSGRRNSNSVLAAPAYQMLNGETLTRETLAAAGLATVDISASNGIIHVINHVLMP
jgi:uncharacterized surface protein with fasciclin (FAS1) repeats